MIAWRPNPTVVRLLAVVAMVLFGLLVAPAQVAEGAEEDNIVERALSGDPADISVSLRIVALLTVLTVAPAILLMTTCFTRIIIVLGFQQRELQ